MQNPRALGRGLASLIMPTSASVEAPPPRDPAAASVPTPYLRCSVRDIIPAKDQPRKIFAKEALSSLADSIREQGILQPLLVRRVAGGKYELIAGERRWRAAQLAGLSEVPALLSEAAPEQVLELALIENLQREDLNPIETALAYRELQEKHHLTQDEIAQRVGKDRSSVSNHLRLLSLPEALRGDLIEGRLSMGHARALLALEDEAAMLRLARRIGEEQLSVRQVEELVRQQREPRTTVSAHLRRGSRLSLEQRSLQEQLTRRLGLKLRLKPQGSGGQLVIDYSSAAELEAALKRWGI